MQRLCLKSSGLMRHLVTILGHNYHRLALYGRTLAAHFEGVEVR